MGSILIACLVLSTAPGSDLAAGEADLDRALASKNFADIEKALNGIHAQTEEESALAVIRARLKDPDPGVRRLAAYALSERNQAEAKKEVGALIEALRDGEPRVRARVALALGKMGAGEAVPALRELLKDVEPRVRVGAARALCTIGGDSQATVAMVIELLKDAEPAIRGLAAGVLEELRPQVKEANLALNLVATTDPDPNVRQAAISALNAIDPPLRVLIAALTDKDVERRVWATSFIAQKGPTAKGVVPHLVEALQHDKETLVRAGAAFALGKIGPEAGSSCPVIIEALKDRAPRVRTAAALALGLFGPAAHGAGPALVTALTDEDGDVTAAAAIALANLGTEAESAIPLLLDLRKQNPSLSRRVISILARIGPEARSACPALVQALNESDPVIRRDAARALVSIGPQAHAPLPALLEALRCTETPADVHVRIWACQSLGEIGPPALDAVPTLITALQDDDHHVRAAACYALGRIGSQAVPLLVKKLDHVDPRVRSGAARALGNIAPADRRLLPVLREAFRDDNPEVQLAAGESVGRIAASLQVAEDTDALPDLMATLQALDRAKGSRLTREQQTEWMNSTEQVRKAIHALQAIQRANIFDRIFRRPWFPWLVGALGYAVIFLSLWSLLLWLRPLMLLKINEVLRPFSRVGLPGLMGLEISLRSLLLVGFFQYHRRVLDAWIAQHVEAFRNKFQANRTVKDRSVYVPIPVVLDGQVVANLTAKQLGQAIRQERGCLLIWGEGGSGKTTLACQLGLWSLAADASERLCDHLMLPVLIEHELDLKVAEGKPPFTALTEAVRGQLQALIGQALSEELLGQLLRRRRILVIVDHLSEISPAAQAAIRPGHADFPAHALVVTSRSEEVLDGVPKSVVQPLRITGNRLSSFMESYLVKCGKRQLFDDAEFFDECRRLSLLAGTREITVLLTKLYAEQMIARKCVAGEERDEGRGMRDEKGSYLAHPSSLFPHPSSLPDLMLGYLNELNRAVDKDQRRSDWEVQRDACVLAWECLRNSLRPEPADLEKAVESLGGTDARVRLAYLEEHLKIVRSAEPARDRVFFTLDPLAEYLAALHLVNKHRTDVDFWRDFATQAAAVQAEQQSIQGFLLAVRECCQVRHAAAGVAELLEKQLVRAA